MYTLDQLIDLLTLDYPDEITYSTDNKRSFNVDTLVSFIMNDIRTNSLKYRIKERRIHLYTTSAGEDIFIQYPGKYSIGKEKYPFDFKPIATVGDTHESLDLDFQGIWRILDKYIQGYQYFMPIFNNLLFRLGRMINHQMVTNEYNSFFVYEDGTRIEPSERLNFPMYQFSFEDTDIMQSLNFHARKINVGNDVNISLEAFLYYLDSLIQIEDCKFKLPKVNETRGRINTADSLMVIYAYYINKIDLAETLQRFVDGRGIASLKVIEYSPVTDNTIQITNTVKRIEHLCDQNNIVYYKRKLSLDGVQIPSRLYIPQKHIVIVSDNLSSQHNLLLARYGWITYNIFNYLGVQSHILDSIILETPYYFDFDFEFEILKKSFGLRTTTRDISKKDYCTITPYCSFIGKDVTLLNETPSEFEIAFLQQKGYNYYVKTNYNSLEALTRFFTYINSL